MATATLNWTGEGINEDFDGTRLTRTIQQKWTVIDALERSDVLAATGLPIINQELSPGSSYRVRSRNPVRSAPRTWEVTITYGIPVTGGFDDPQDNPLDEPMRIQWGLRTKRVAKQLDVSKRPIRNSSGQFFDPLPETEIVVETLQIRRYEAFYDRDKARTYRNTVNKNPFVIGTTQILPYECKCNFIGPTTEYRLGAPYLEILYDFELDIESRAEPGVSGYPFDFHIVDQGTIGYYSEGGTVKQGRFCTFKVEGSDTVLGSLIDDPVLLDGTGIPIDFAKIWVCDDRGKIFPPVTNPTTAHHMDAPGLTGYESPFSTKPGTLESPRIWLFGNLKAVDFSGIF